jgi:RimJ/RimL family protein N-acetyltransferase
MKTLIETERLILRELVPDDAAGMFALDSDPEVHKYVGNKPITSIDQASHVIELIRAQYAANGIGRWAVIERATGNFVGWSGLKLMKEPINGHVNHLDLGYRFIKQYWGRGYATETAVASVRYGFEEMNRQHIYGITHIDNLASQNVLKKCGLKFVETFDFEGTPHHWFQIQK